MSTTHEALTLAASRAESVNRRGATEKQVAFLASLIEQHGDNATSIECGLAQSHAILTARGASGWIDDYLSRPKPAPVPKVSSISITLKPVVEMLHGARAHLNYPKISFENADVRLSVAGQRARVPGSINVTSNDKFGDNEFYGRILEDGTFEAARACTEEVGKFLTNLARDPEGVVKASGQNTGACCFCLKTLTEDRSRAVGYGPVCAKNFNLPH